MAADEYIDRLNRLIDLVREDIDILFIYSSVNIRYFTSLVVESLERLSLLIIDLRSGEKYILSPELERNRVLGVCDAYGFNPIIYCDGEDPYSKLKSIVGDVDWIGIEERMPYGIYRNIRDVVGDAGIRLIDEFISRMRMVKDSNEIHLLEKASHINQETIRFLIENLRPGISEKELALDGCRYALSLGAESCPYPIIQSGPNTSLPHQSSTDRVIREDDLVLIDFSVSYEGYVSDVTRVVALGGYSKYRRVFELVKSAQDEALSHVSPGVYAGDIDASARNVIESAGYGEFFTHRTGHGIGLEIHEEPYIYSGSTQVLLPGMVFTIEPGIYIRGEYGVRLEDNVVVTLDGYRNLVDLPRELDGRLYCSGIGSPT